MMTREERVEAVRKRLQDELDAKLAEREALGKPVSSLDRWNYWVDPAWAELIVKMEDDIAAMKEEEEGKS